MSCLPQEISLSLSTPHGSRLAGCALEAKTPLTGLFIHGFRSDRAGTKSLAFVEHAAAKGYAWQRWDLSGHGDSSGAFRDFRLSTLLADLEQILNHIDRPVLLVGSSMGGWLATLAALRRPNQVKGLVLIAPAFNFIQLNFGSIPSSELRQWQQARWRRFASAEGGDAYELDYGVLADARAFDLLWTPQTLACPVSVIHGEHDESVPVSVSERFLSRLTAPAQRFHVVPGGDHRLNAAIPLMLAEIDRLWSTEDAPRRPTEHK